MNVRWITREEALERWPSVNPRPAIPPEMIVAIPPILYREAERAGVDMRYYRRVEPIPKAK